MNNKKSIAVFGLGSMGAGIAKSLLKSGYVTYGFDVDQKLVTKFADEGGTVGKIEEVIGSVDAVIIVVLNSSQTKEILFGKTNVVPLMKPGSIVISCATVAPAFARTMSKSCEEFSVHYLDAPISGGAKKALSGELSIMASGTQEAFSAASLVLKSISSTVFELGDVAGAGSAMKAVNQLLAGIHIAAMAEALTFGMTQGVTPQKFLEVISKCAGTSWMLENRAPHIIDGDYTPHSSINIWPKDLGIVLDIAKDSKFSAPLTAAALQQFLAASGSGYGQEDDAAIAKIYARNAGLTLPGEQ